jgi:hypothetical protein
MEAAAVLMAGLPGAGGTDLETRGRLADSSGE